VEHRLSSPLCAQVRDRHGSIASCAVNRQQLRALRDHAKTYRKHVPVSRCCVRAGEYIQRCFRSR
jgi:hypothetical protein